MPNLTIAIPTYNRAPWLRQALSTLLNQTDEEFEVLVADNGSTDETASVLAEFRDPRIRYFRHPKNIGMVENFEFCGRTAETDWILIHQDDDLLSPLFVERWRSAVTRHPELVMFAAEIASSAATDEKRFWQTSVRNLPLEHRWDQPSPRVVPGLAFAAMQFVQTGFLFPCVTLRTEIFRDGFIPDPAVPGFNDRYMNFKAGCAGPVGYEAFVGGIMRAHGEQASCNYDGIAGAMQCSELMLEHFAEHELDWQSALREFCAEFNVAALAAWSREGLLADGTWNPSIPGDARHIVAERPAAEAGCSVEEYLESILAERKFAERADRVKRPARWFARQLAKIGA